MVSNVSSGIEPLPAIVYRRTWKTIDENGRSIKKSEVVVDPSFYDYDTEVLESASDLHPRDHFEIQKIIQKHVDNSISKTINLPKDYSIDELGYLWLEYLPYMKGSTFYRWGSRKDEPISPIAKEEWGNYINVEASTNEDIFNDCVNGLCSLNA